MRKCFQTRRALACLGKDENNVPITGMDGIVGSNGECKQVVERSTTVVRHSTIDLKLKVLRLRASASHSQRSITFQTGIHPTVILQLESYITICGGEALKTIEVL